MNQEEEIEFNGQEQTEQEIIDEEYRMLKQLVKIPYLPPLEQMQ
jgi:hypothetical protein